MKTTKKHVNRKIRAFLDTYFEMNFSRFVCYNNDFYASYALNLEHVAGKADEVGADAESGAAAGRHGEGGHVSVQNAKGGSGNQRDQANLVHVELALGNGISSQGNQGTLNQILNGAFAQLA